MNSNSHYKITRVEEMVISTEKIALQSLEPGEVDGFISE